MKYWYRQLKRSKKRTKQDLLGSFVIPEVGFEPTRPQRTLDFESSASASSATPAYYLMMLN